MPKILENRWGVFGWGVVASMLLHLAVAAVFFLKLPEQPPKPPEEETLNVELVPPPEEKKPEEKKPEEKKPELKVPDEPKPEEKKAQEKPAEKPAEAPKAEAKADEPPPPPPEPPKPPEEKPPEAPPKEKAPEEKPPEEKPPEEAKAEQPKPEEQSPQASSQQGKPQPVQPLRPVFEFGDRNTGPQKSETGDASAAAAKPDATPPNGKPEPVEPATATEPVVDDKPPANPVPDDIELPQVAAAESHQEKNGPPPEAIGEAKTDFEQAKPSEMAKTEVKEPARPAPDALTEAKTLFSRNATDDPVAKTAMDNLPRGLRVAQLCTTELREQLRHSPSNYRPELLPSYRLSSGTVLEVRRGAFRASARWYDMSFRCEVDADATKVLSFAFDVGDQVPKSQWKSRGFPQ
jgi:hypothetical protein